MNMMPAGTLLNTKPRKDARTLLFCSILIFCTAAVFAVTGDAPHVLLITVLALVVSRLIPQPLPRNVRSFVYTGVLIMVLTVVQDQIFPVSANRFFLLPAQLYCPAIIYLAVAATFFDQRDTTLTALMALALIGTMLAGNTVVAVQTNPRFSITDPLLEAEAYHVFYGIMAIIQILMVLALLPRTEQRRYVKAKIRTNNRYLVRQLIIGGALLLVFLSAAGMRWAAFSYERSMQRTFSDLFQRYMIRRSKWVIFGNDVDLWRTVPLRAAQDRTIAFRVLANDSPGYMRGRVYALYGRGRWSIFSKGQNLPSTDTGGRYVFKVFQRDITDLRQKKPDPPALSARTDVLPAADFRSDVLLAPGKASRFELIAEDLTNSLDGVLHPRDWDWKGGYTFFQETAGQNSAYPLPTEMTEALREQYLHVPAEISDALEDYSDGIFDASSATDVHTRITDLLRHFRHDFEYELGIEMQPDLDPVLQFLQNNKRGHCELFAAATVLLLRTQGIPARYVTGFVCNEPHPAGKYWLARLQDAHAWAEAYVAKEKRWVLIESTPADGIPAPDSEMNLFAAFLDRITLFWQELLARMKRGYIAEAIVTVIIGVGKSIYWLFNHPIRGPLFIFLGLLIVQERLRRRKRRKKELDQEIPAARQGLIETLVKLEKKMKTLGVERQKWQTVGEYAQTVRENLAADEAAVITELLREYELLRYQQHPPPPKTIEGFAQKVQRQLRKIS